MQNSPKHIPDPFITVEESLTKGVHLKKTIFDFDNATIDPMEYFLQMNLPSFIPTPHPSPKAFTKVRDEYCLNKKPPEELKQRVLHSLRRKITSFIETLGRDILFTFKGVHFLQGIVSSGSELKESEWENLDLNFPVDNSDFFCEFLTREEFQFKKRLPFSMIGKIESRDAFQTRCLKPNRIEGL